MKRKVFVIPLLLLLPLIAFSNNHAHLFSYDKEAVEETFSRLDQLEKQITLQEVTNDGTPSAASLFSADLTGINSSSIPTSPMFDINNMDWGAFAWGFLCCPVGFFVVAINKDKPQVSKTSYWIGVIASSIVSAISTAASGIGNLAVTP